MVLRDEHGTSRLRTHLCGLPAVWQREGCSTANLMVPGPVGFLNERTQSFAPAGWLCRILCAHMPATMQQLGVHRHYCNCRYANTGMLGLHRFWLLQTAVHQLEHYAMFTRHHVELAQVARHSIVAL